jgi:sugar O-acyltransferase (sialic acid O-acetyltransferase NeuD family)
VQRRGAARRRQGEPRVEPRRHLALELLGHRPRRQGPGTQDAGDEADVVLVDVRRRQRDHCATIAQVSARVVIVGAGAHGAVVADILQRACEAGGGAVPIGFVDDTPSRRGTAILGLDVLGPISSLADHPHDAVIVAIGDNRTRRTISEQLLAAGERLATAVHPAASVAPSVTLGDGTMVCAGAVITPRAAIGRGVIVNTRASIDHDSIVGDFGHVSSGATVGGRVRIGTETLIAVGATVVTDMTIGARTIIGAGAVVVEAIPDDVVAFGVPARIRPNRS